MTLGAWGAPEWIGPGLAIFAAAALAVAWSYCRTRGAGGRVALLAAALKGIGLGALALCLADPLLSGVRPRRGANIFAVVVDDSQSLQIRDSGSHRSRGERLQRILLDESPWQTRLGQDFDVRRLAFSTQLQAVDDYSALAFDGSGTSLGGALDSLARRFRGLPIAGMLLLTDGNATDVGGEGGLWSKLPWSELPPIYPVAAGVDESLVDVSVERVSATETNFESAPVTVRADVRSTGADEEPVTVSLYDEQGKVVETQTARPDPTSHLASVRFQIRPEETGISFYSVGARTLAEASGDDEAKSAASPDVADENDADADAEIETAEATLANNRRLVAVDRGGGPYRVLYVSGRPNWEFKFLRRALADDDQIELVGLLRIAKREPKFSFRSRDDQDTNQLFEGFENPDGDAAESYDEPVIVRLGTKDENELRDGFPRSADELYAYDAIVLDDLETEFFTPDQLTLIEDFVSRRGGGLLMLGGAESFLGGNYRRTPIADALPVYLDSLDDDNGSGDGPSIPPRDQKFRLALTREGWLEEWVRLRKTEPEDRERLATMPAFQTVNPVGRLKPGATVLARVLDESGAAYPALVAQRYGRGRSAALLIGDLWRWGLRRSSEQDDDLDKSWRQTIRWLVSDVPQRVDVSIEPAVEAAAGAVAIQVRVHDEKYLPLDNAEVSVTLKTPDDREITLQAEPSVDEAGAYIATHVPRVPGAYRALVKATAPDGSDVGDRETGWAAQPLADEFQRLAPNHELLAEIAAKTGGEPIDVENLDDFVATLDSRRAPVTEPWTRPLWHHPLFFVVTIGCLAGEWGLRRWKGLA
jgi:uncharacterized membrane protein